MSKSHRRIVRNTVAERACTLIAVMLKERANEFVSRREIEEMLLTTRYTATAFSKVMSYIDDMITYHDASLTYQRQGKFVTHVRLNNAYNFNAKGFRATVAERQQMLIDAVNAAVAETVTIDAEIVSETFVLDHASDCTDVALLAA